MHTKCGLENLQGRGYLEDICFDGRIVLECILGEICCEGVDWIHLAQDGDL